MSQSLLLRRQLVSTTTVTMASRLKSTSQMKFNDPGSVRIQWPACRVSMPNQTLLYFPALIDTLLELQKKLETKLRIAPVAPASGKFREPTADDIKKAKEIMPVINPKNIPNCACGERASVRKCRYAHTLNRPIIYTNICKNFFKKLKNNNLRHVAGLPGAQLSG